MCGEPLPPDLRVAADLVVDHLAGHRLAVDDAEWLDAPEVDLLVAIIPRIERILASRSYAFDWLLVRQELTGQAGVR